MDACWMGPNLQVAFFVFFRNDCRVLQIILKKLFTLQEMITYPTKNFKNPENHHRLKHTLGAFGIYDRSHGRSFPPSPRALARHGPSCHFRPTWAQWSRARRRNLNHQRRDLNDDVSLELLGRKHPRKLTCRYQKLPFLKGPVTFSKPSFWVSMLVFGSVPFREWSHIPNAPGGMLQSMMADFPDLKFLVGFVIVPWKGMRSKEKTERFGLDDFGFWMPC